MQNITGKITNIERPNLDLSQFYTGAGGGRKFPTLESNTSENDAISLSYNLRCHSPN